MKIYKPVVLKKLRFSEKFLHYILYAQKTALKIGSIKPFIIIIILVLKLYLGYKRMRLDLAEFIDFIEENKYNIDTKKIYFKLHRNIN